MKARRGLPPKWYPLFVVSLTTSLVRARIRGMRCVAFARLHPLAKGETKAALDVSGATGVESPSNFLNRRVLTAKELVTIP